MKAFYLTTKIGQLLDMKILIHIHDFLSHNLFEDSKFRLNQFDKLADRFLDIITTVVVTDDDDED